MLRCLGKTDAFHSPSVVAKDTPERRIPLHIPTQTDRCRVEPRGDSDGRSLVFLINGFDLHGILQHPVAPRMDAPDRRSNLRIFVRAEVFEKKVDQSPFTLQHYE